MDSFFFIKINIPACTNNLIKNMGMPRSLVILRIVENYSIGTICFAYRNLTETFVIWLKQ